MEVSKGQFLGVKAPPYFAKEYVYQVTSAGQKLVRADLYGSPSVSKSWTAQELKLLIEMGVVRLMPPSEVAQLIRSKT